MIKRRILFYLLFVSSIVNAQVFISGRITDTVGSPIPNINVLVHSAGVTAISAYGFSDNEGRYSIKVNSSADSLDIKTNSMFYKKAVVRVANATQSVDFVLSDEVQELKGVTVRARPIEQRGDTLEYFVGSFVQKEDKSIEDVLKRMPGIEVSSSGQITYQGAPIQKFYVEGMDLMDGRYAMVSKNLPHQSVASVEIYENHQPIKILEDRMSSEQASLNIKLAKNITMTGSGKVGIGAPFLWDVSATPMIFTSKMQAVVSYQSNNTGNDVTMFLKQMAYNQLFSDRPSETDEELSIKKANPPMFDYKRYLDNYSHLANVNMLLPIGKTTQIRTNIYYLNDIQLQNAEQKNTIFLPSDTTIYTEKIKNKSYDQKVFGTITIDRNDKVFYLNDKLNFSKQWSSGIGNLINSADNIRQSLDQQSMALSNDMRVIFPVGKHLFDFVSFNSYGITPESLEIEPGVFAPLLNDSAAYSKTRQELIKKQFFTDESFSAIFKIGPVDLSAKAGISHSEKTARSALMELENTAEHRYTKSYAQMNMEYKIRRFTFTLNLPLSFDIARINGETIENQHIEHLFFVPSVSMKLKIGGLWDFYTSTRIGQNIDNFDHYYENYVLKDYNSLVKEAAPLSISHNILSNVKISFKQPFISLNAMVSYTYQHRHAAMMYKYSIDSQGASVLQTVELPNERYFHIVQASVKKFFPSIRTTISLKVNASINNGQSLLNDELAKASSLSTSMSPRAMIKVAEWLHLDYSFNYNIIHSRVGNNNNDISYFRHIGDIMIFPWTDHNICITSELYDYQDDTFVYTDVSYQYSLRKHKLDFELRLSNIFNNDVYVSYFTGAFSLMESVYELRPRELSASVRFRF
ncbi:MAG: carboxypeptidase-like regulatory domain-containing protein [Candidatus Limimorpha sp.]